MTIMRKDHPRAVVGRRKAVLFNDRFSPGDLVAVRRVPGEPASWDRVFAPAYGAGDAAVVELASSLVPVDTDIVFAWEAVDEDRDEDDLPRCREPRLPVWKITTAFVIGFAVAVLIGLLVPPAKAVSPAQIVIDCDAPGTAPAEAPALVDPDGRVQA